MLTVLNTLALMMFNRDGLRDRFIDGRDWNSCWYFMRQAHIWPMILGFVLLVGLVVLIVWLVLKSRKHPGYGQYKPVPPAAPGPGPVATAGPDAGADTGAAAALQILNERYARGEIDEDEYLRRKNNIRGS